MKKMLLIPILLLALIGCSSTERTEIRSRTPNFVAVESDAPRTAKKTNWQIQGKSQNSVAKAIKRKTSVRGQIFQKGDNTSVAYAVTQGTMLLFDGGKQHFVPFQEGPLESELVRKIMEIDERYFEMFGGFEGHLKGNEITITSQDTYDQKPIYHWVTSEKARYAVEIPEVARNRFENEKFKYVALEIVDPKDPKKKYYFHVDPRNISRPMMINRNDAKVHRVVMGNSEALNKTISKHLWINEAQADGGPRILLASDTNARPIQVMHLVKLFFSPEEQEFYDEKYESPKAEVANNSNSPTKNLVLIGRFTGEGVITGKFEKGTRSDVFDVNSTVQYHFKQNALTVGRGGIQDKPTRMEIEFFTLKLGQDEDQLRLALQQAQYKRQQKLNVFFIDDGKKRLQEMPDFSFSLKRVDDAAKLAMIKKQKLVPVQSDGSFTNPKHLTGAILELDLKASTQVIQ